MNPIDAVLARLDQVKPTGRDRWRSACPACGGSNRSALSIGVGEHGGVLLHCFKSECDAETIAAAIGLTLEQLFAPRDSHGASPQRRRMLTAHQALDLLADEANLVFVAAGNIAHGVELRDEDRARCLTAAGRVAYLRDEVLQ